MISLQLLQKTYYINMFVYRVAGKSCWRNCTTPVYISVYKLLLILNIHAIFGTERRTTNNQSINRYDRKYLPCKRPPTTTPNELILIRSCPLLSICCLLVANRQDRYRRFGKHQIDTELIHIDPLTRPLKERFQISNAATGKQPTENREQLLI